MSIINVSTETFISKLKRISQSIVWKDRSAVVKYENDSNFEAVDFYIHAYEGELGWDTVRSYSVPFLNYFFKKHEIHISEETISQYSYNKNLIPLEYRDAIAEEYPEYVIDQYENHDDDREGRTNYERNNYYRRLFGLPNLDDEDSYWIIYKDKTSTTSEGEPLDYNTYIVNNTIKTLISKVIFEDKNVYIFKLDNAYLNSIVTSDPPFGGSTMTCTVRKWFKYFNAYGKSHSNDAISWISITEDSKITRLENELAGYFDIIYDSITDQSERIKKKYILHMYHKRIVPYYARKKEAFELLYFDNTIDDYICRDFEQMYQICRDYVMRVHYSSAFKYMNDYYEGLIGMSILLMTIQRMYSKYIEADITRDFYDIYSLKYVYDSYGVPYYNDIPLNYHKQIIKAINRLISYKGSYKIIADLCQLFNFSSSTVNQYYLIKNRNHDENGNPIIEHITSDMSESEILNELSKSYKLAFIKVPYDDDPYPYLKNQRNMIDYFSFTEDDTLWKNDYQLLRQVYSTPFNYKETKYLGIDILYDMMKIVNESCYFIQYVYALKNNRLLNDGDGEDILIQYDQVDSVVPLFEFILYLTEVICRHQGFHATVNTDTAAVAKLMGYNFREDLEALKYRYTSKKDENGNYLIEDGKFVSRDFIWDEDGNKKVIGSEWFEEHAQSVYDAIKEYLDSEYEKSESERTNNDYEIDEDIVLLNDANGETIGIPNGDELYNLYIRINNNINKDKIEGIMRIIEDGIRNATDYEAYTMYRRLRDVLLTTKASREMFVKPSGDTYNTVEEYLRDVADLNHNTAVMKLIERLSILEEEYESGDAYAYINEMEYSIDAIEDYLNSKLEYFNTVTNINNNRILRYLKNLIAYFKSAKVTFLGFDIVFTVGGFGDNFIKLLMEFDHKEKTRDIPENNELMLFHDISYSKTITRKIESRQTFFDQIEKIIKTGEFLEYSYEYFSNPTMINANSNNEVKISITGYLQWPEMDPNNIIMEFPLLYDDDKKVVALGYQNTQKAIWNTALVSPYVNNFTEVKLEKDENDQSYITHIFPYAFSMSPNLSKFNGEGFNAPDSLIYIGEKAFYQCSKLSGPINISNVTYIGNDAFNECSLLTGNINAPYLEYIGIGAFEKSGITGISNLNSVEIIESHAFNQCTTLSGDIDLPNLSELGSYAFYSCSGITGSITMENVESIGQHAFEKSSISGQLNLSKVKTIGRNAFYECSSLTGPLSLPEATTLGVSAFEKCTGLTGRLNIPKMETIGDYTFNQCTGLTSFTLPGSLTSLGQYAFSTCLNLAPMGETLDIPSGISTISDYAFFDCLALGSTINMPDVTSIGTQSFGITNTNEASALTINIGESITNISADAFTNRGSQQNYPLIINMNMTKSYARENLPDLFNSAPWGANELAIVNWLANPIIYTWEYANPQSTNVNATGDSASNDSDDINITGFKEWEDMDHDNIIMTFPLTYENKKVVGLGYKAGTGPIWGNSVIGPYVNKFTEVQFEKDEFNNTNIENIHKNAFVSSSQLRKFNSDDYEIIMPNSVKFIGSGAFSGCTNLTNGSGKTIKLNNVEIIDAGAFSGCSGLRNSTLDSPKVKTIESGAFGGCMLKTLILPSVEEIKPGAFSGNNIEGELNFPKAKLIGTGNFSGMQGITSLNFPEVEELSSSSFGGCRGIKSISMPKVKTIGDSAFNGCAGLTSLNLPVVKTIGNSVFSGCSNLTSINLPDVETIGMNCFEKCTNIYHQENLNLPKVKSIGNYAFRYCGIPGNIYLPKVETIGAHAFDNFYSTSGVLTIPKVKTIGEYAFNQCSSMTGEIESSEICSIGSYAFSNCNHLTGSLNLESDGLTVIPDNVFYNCYSLDGELKFGSGITSIGSRAFYECRKLTGSINIPNATSLGAYAFYDCNSLDGELKFGSGIASIGSNAFDGCNKLTGSINIPNVTSLGAYAFRYCANLDGTLTLSNELTKIDTATFQNCNNLTGTLTIPSKVTTINQLAFSGCGFTKLVLNEGLKTIGSSAFSNSPNYTGDLVIPNTVESIGSLAFGGCKFSNGHISIPNNSVYTKILSSTFRECSGLIGDLVIPDNITKIESDAFYKCQGLDGNLILPDNLVSIGSFAFDGCSNLKEFNLPSNLTEIGMSAFSGCTNLHPVSGSTSLVIPSGITIIPGYVFSSCYGFNGYDLILPDELDIIGRNAFSSCGFTDMDLILPSKLRRIEISSFSDNNFKKVVIPESVEYIGSQSFYECLNLKNVIINTTAAIEDYAFAYSNCVEEITSQSYEIKSHAFYSLTNLNTASLFNVTKIGESAFELPSTDPTSDIDRNINIYGLDISEISNNAFSGLGINRPLKINFIDMTEAYARDNFPDMYNSAPWGGGEKTTVTWAGN